MKKTCLTLIISLLLTHYSIAQKSGDLGITGGGTYYVGELNPGLPFRMTKPAYGAIYRQNFNTRIAVRLHGFKGSVAGDDAVSKANLERNLNFTSDITEIGAQLEINFLEYFIGSRMHPITPYLFGGVAGFMFEPYGIVDGSKVALKPLTTEGPNSGYKLYSISLPFGFGVKYSVNKFIGIGAEWGLRKTFTDYIDDVSTTYYLDLLGKDPALATEHELASDPTLLHKSGMQRGNSQNKDWYSYAGAFVTIKIKMLGKERCLDHQREGY